jgi:hypothetical protein
MGQRLRDGGWFGLVMGVGGGLTWLMRERLPSFWGRGMMGCCRTSWW